MTSYNLTENFSVISAADSRDRIANISIKENLPSSIDLKPHVFEVENQYQYGSCTANAGCSALELAYNINKTPVDLSRFYLYYYTRLIGNLKGDVGAYPRDIGKALLNYGVPYERLWDYIPENLDREPTAKVIAEAAQFKITSYETIVGTKDSKLQQIKSALAQNIPVLLSIIIHNDFFTLTGDWKGHSWDWETSVKNPSQGGHEVLIIGYDDTTQRLLVENSWGPGWGDGGFFGLPYSMLDSSSFGELWIVRPNLDVYIKEETIFEKLEKFLVKNSRILVVAGFLAITVALRYT